MLGPRLRLAWWRFTRAYDGPDVLDKTGLLVALLVSLHWGIAGACYAMPFMALAALWRLWVLFGWARQGLRQP